MCSLAINEPIIVVDHSHSFSSQSNNFPLPLRRCRFYSSPPQPIIKEDCTLSSNQNGSFNKDHAAKRRQRKVSIPCLINRGCYHYYADVNKSKDFRLSLYGVARTTRHRSKSHGRIFTRSSKNLSHLPTVFKQSNKSIDGIKQSSAISDGANDTSNQSETLHKPVSQSRHSLLRSSSCFRSSAKQRSFSACFDLDTDDIGFSRGDVWNLLGEPLLRHQRQSLHVSTEALTRVR